MNGNPLQIFCAALLIFCAPAKAGSFWQTVLRVTGVSATPSQQKAPGENLEHGGEVWIASVRSGELRRLGTDGDFRSPVFTPDDRAAVAVKAGSLWRIPLDDRAPKRLHSIEGLVKLVGFDSANTDKLLTLISHDGVTSAAWLSMSTGESIPIPHDANSPDDRRLLSHLRNWERTYGQAKVYVQPQSKQGLTGPVEWNDVFFKSGNDAPVNISHGDGVQCGHPSLSHDATSIVFVRARE